MANVQIEQRNAHLASAVRLETVTGRDGDVCKATLTAISNSWRRKGEAREDEPTAVQWTLWGKQAENAARYLGKGSHVNVCGRLRNNHYLDAHGNTVFGFTFTCEEIDYLDSRSESEARRAREPEAAEGSASGSGRGKDARPDGMASRSAAFQDDDIPF